MDKNGKFELYKLVESKFKKKYINGKPITEADFTKLGLTSADLEEFMNLYVPKWKQYLFWKDDDLGKENSDGLIVPTDSTFYNFGVKNIDIQNLKLLLNSRNRIISIHKPTGQVFSSWVNEEAIKYGGFTTDEINDFTTIEIKSFWDFFKNLEDGKMDEILSVKLFEKRYYTVPEDIDLFNAQKVLDLYLLASHLESENEILVYEEGMGWWSYENLAQFKDPDEDDLAGYTKSAHIFIAKRPREIHFELINGNLDILSEIKLKRNFWG